MWRDGCNWHCCDIEDIVKDFQLWDGRDNDVVIRNEGGWVDYEDEILIKKW